MLQLGFDVLSVREPGGTEIGENIRSLVTAGIDRKPTDSTTEIFLFAAARSALVHEKLLPHLNAGGIVICDHYLDSTIAYQGYGRCMESNKIPTLKTILEFATEGLKPDLSFYLDLPETEVRKKIDCVRVDQPELFESASFPAEFDREENRFYSRVRTGYREIGRTEEFRWVEISAQLPEKKIHRMVMKHVRAGLKGRQLLRGDHGRNVKGHVV